MLIVERRSPSRQRAQTGLSLTELMVSIAVGAFLALAGTTFYVTTVRSGKDLFDSAKQFEQVNAVLSTLGRDLRRAGYRGGPTELGAYLATTQGGPGVPGDEGDFPPVDISTPECVLYTYANDYSCIAGDGAKFNACDDGAGGTLVGTAVPLHHRFGFRLRSGVVEGVAVIHPGAYNGAPPSVDSSCSASGANSAWEPVTVPEEVYVDTFAVTLEDETYYNADTGCELGTVGSSCASNVPTDCGDTVSCRIERLYKARICAYPGTGDGQCVPAADGSQPDGQIFNELYVSPRNDVLIARVYL